MDRFFDRLENSVKVLGEQYGASKLLLRFAAIVMTAIGLTIIVGTIFGGTAAWGSIPMWITGIVAVSALMVAIFSIVTQRELARKKAAFDFFAKSEMDQAMLAAHTAYLDGAEVLRKHLAKGNPITDFEDTQKDAYREIRNYLNIHELMSVGITQDVFDDHVCYYYWSGELTRAHSDCRALIEHIRSRPGDKNAYKEFVAVNERWLARPEQVHL